MDRVDETTSVQQCRPQAQERQAACALLAPALSGGAEKSVRGARESTPRPRGTWRSLWELGLLVAAVFLVRCGGGSRRRGHLRLPSGVRVKRDPVPVRPGPTVGPTRASRQSWPAAAWWPNL